MPATRGGGHTITLPPVCTLAKNFPEDNSFSLESLVDNTSHLLKEELGFVKSHTEDILMIMD